MSVAQEIEALLLAEARLLDQERHDEWLELLTDDVTVHIPLGAQLEREQMSIIREDRFRTEARVWRVAQTGLNHTQDPPSRTVRAVSNVEVEVGTAGETARAHFVVVLYEYRPHAQRLNEPMRTFPMRCEYTFRKESDRWLISGRQLMLLQRDTSLPPMTYIL
ncbi:aromatic-ring-hydroxylating dioxygenase subunit beta [Nocardia sp. NPDC050799]|uniref:aromatic-ring-hydroxylating dioxygenase subunit beta n=1 Tax=Nocardia sp. NPDC050799 TaxID=3154842 RepID=UPI0034100784